ncbi:MAG: 6-carboxytetrahydropterin synthase QueD [Proteobacteria bacterium]|nr:6-carboxytetrahydropterin synthase QueD [Pseudomonadota bacterium]
MSGVYEIYVKNHFSAAHSLRGYAGDCSRLHGHNWIIEVYVKCRTLDDLGIGIDFRDIKKAIKDVLEDLDHFNLNELPAFTEINPTSENIARYLYEEIGRKFNSTVVTVSRVKVSETPGAGAFYYEE